jgi:hypothetical protein
MEKSGENPCSADGDLYHSKEEEHISGNYSTLLTEHNRYVSYGTFSLFIGPIFSLNGCNPQKCRDKTSIYVTCVQKKVGKYDLSAYPTSEHESAHNVKVKSHLII